MAGTNYRYKGRGLMQITGRNSGKSYWTNQAIQRLMNDLQSRPVEALTFGEGKVYGSHYYTVEPDGGNWLEMETWCLDTFGPTGDIWNETKNLTPEPLQRWYMNNRKFWFKDVKDRDWFVIKWSS